MTLIERWSQSMMDNYGTPPLALVRGAGAVVTDEAGRQYLDLLGGIAVNALGHAHPAVIAAVSEQIATLGHVSNLFVAEPPVALAELLLALAGRPGGCCSATPAPRRTRPRSSYPGSPAAPRWSPPRAASTAGPWARCR
jgi:acetylornithine/succinyldiaminopimelate/putrescine aminotransferase